MTENLATPKTSWHLLFSKLFEELLPPVGISVQHNVKIMSQSPEADILLLKREKTGTKAQRERLPDGIRDSHAIHLLLEFKYTESITDFAIRQALVYDTLYKKHQDLSEAEVQTFLISAKKKQKERLANWGYVSTEQAGVYHNPLWLLKDIPLISLNELSDETHNAWVKCFASHLIEKRKAFEALKSKGLGAMTAQLKWFLRGLWQHWFNDPKEDDMILDMTPEQVTKMGEMWGEVFLNELPIEKRLAGLKSQDILSRFNPEERLVGLKPEEWLAALKPEEIEDYLNKIKQK
jgi:hypothetical protein